jgi:hypothetical protein
LKYRGCFSSRLHGDIGSTHLMLYAVVLREGSIVEPSVREVATIVGARTRMGPRPLVTSDIILSYPSLVSK